MSDAEFLAWGRYLPMNLLPPLLLALAIAASDLHSRRIPNYLTFGGALAGLFYQTVFFGWSGLGQGLFGLLLGLGLLLIPYILGGDGCWRCQRFGCLRRLVGSQRLFFPLLLYGDSWRADEFRCVNMAGDSLEFSQTRLGPVPNHGLVSRSGRPAGDYDAQFQSDSGHPVWDGYCLGDGCPAGAGESFLERTGLSANRR